MDVCGCASVGTPIRSKGKPMSKYDMYGKFHLDLHSKDLDFFFLFLLHYVTEQLIKLGMNINCECKQ